MKTSFLNKSLGAFLCILFFANQSFSQCPTAGSTLFGNQTISSNCTVSGDLTLQGPTLTIDPGVTLTVTGNLTIQGSATVSGSSTSIINIGGNLVDAWTSGGSNSISGGTYNITGDIRETSGGTFEIDNAIVSADSIATSGGSSFDVINGSDITVARGVRSVEGLNVNNAKLDIGGTLEVTGGDDVTISNNGELIIRGDYDLNGSGGGGIVMTVETGGIVRVFGDVNSSTGGNTINVDDNSGISVDGDFVGGSAPAVSVGSGGGTSCTSGGGCCGSASACGTATTLPVSLISFTHQVDETIVKLEWSTASELNNDFFTVERSIDGLNFTEICQVQGAGTINEISNYSHTDRLSSSAQAYYRLSQTDYDGTHVILGVISATTSGLANQVLVYPNPVEAKGRVWLSGVLVGTDWSIYSLSGAQLASGKLSADGEVEISGLLKGTYLLKVENGSKSSVLVIR